MITIHQESIPYELFRDVQDELVAQNLVLKMHFLELMPQQSFFGLEIFSF